MQIKECTATDSYMLAEMNKRLIEDEKSNNPMNIEELKGRMQEFLEGEYAAYFFLEEDVVIGYALVRYTSNPLYLRQFFIEREYRRKKNGKQAFQKLMEYLNVETMDIDVLPWNNRGLSFWQSCGFKETCISMRYKK